MLRPSLRCSGRSSGGCAKRAIDLYRRSATAPRRRRKRRGGGTHCCFSPRCPPSSGTCRRNKIFRNPSGDWPPQHQQLPDYGRGPDAESEMCGVSGSWRFEREPVVKLVHGPAGNSKITTSRKHVRGLAADTRNKHARCFTCSGVQPPTYCIDKAFDFEFAGLNLAVSTFHGLQLSGNEGYPVFLSHIHGTSYLKFDTTGCRGPAAQLKHRFADNEQKQFGKRPSQSGQRKKKVRLKLTDSMAREGKGERDQQGSLARKHKPRHLNAPPLQTHPILGALRKKH